MKTTCDTCGEVYAITRENAKMCIFLAHPECNHVSMTCEHCGAHEVLYMKPQSCARNISAMKLQLEICAEADDELRERARRAWESVEPEPPKPELPVILELTPRMEGEVERFGRNMEAIPLELFWDIMNDAWTPDRPLHWL